MKKQLAIALVALWMVTTAQAQWRIGVTGGVAFNHPTIDKQYMTDLVYKDRCGLSFGLMGQYDFNDWLGVRAELDWVQKNYRQTRNVAENQDYKYTNNYLLMPVMASFSFGGEKLRGFCNVGVYGGYWLNSHRKGEDFHNVSDYTYTFSEKVEFDDDRDQRWDCGSVSMAEITSLSCKQLSNGTLIGKRTHGGLCSLQSDPSVYYENYSGIVGVRYQTPVWLYIPHMVTMSKDKQLFEGVGVTPDIDVDFDITLSQTTGRDTQLDRALQYLRTGN